MDAEKYYHPLMKMKKTKKKETSSSFFGTFGSFFN